MLFRLPDVPDRAVARKNAKSVAELLGVRVLARRFFAVGHPECPYELRWNADPYWFGARISDSAYIVQGTAKNPYESITPFAASLKAKDHTMLLRLPVEPLSTELGVQVFVSDAKDGPPAAKALRSPECNEVLRRIDFEPIRSLFVSPHQLLAVSDWVTPRHCVDQMTAMRELLLALGRWHSARS